MSRRNFTLLIILISLIIIGVFLFLLFRKTPATPGNPGTGTNFFSSFNPFGNKNTPSSSEQTPPANVSGYTPPAEITNTPLKKVSSMPIAGFGLFSKERYKEVPPPTPADTGGAGDSSNAATSGMDSSSATTSSGTGTGTGAGTVKTTPSPKPTAPQTEFALAVRYAARATGNIYQTFADNIDERRFSSTIIPQIYDAYFGANAESVVMRYLDTDGRTIKTYAGTLPKETLGADSDSNEIKGSFLPDNIFDLSLSSDLTQIFYLFDSDDAAAGVTANTPGDKKVQVFSSPFTEWLSSWPNSKTITLTTKPAAALPGYMYVLDPAKKTLSRVLGNINGLTTLTSPDGKEVLYADDSLGLFLYNITSGNTEALPVNTLPDKCTWTSDSEVIYCGVPRIIPSNKYPDSWYRGIESFSDQFWKIDPSSGETIMLVDPLNVPNGEEIDGIKLAVDKDQTYLFFMNKKDSFLWELGLK